MRHIFYIQPLVYNIIMSVEEEVKTNSHTAFWQGYAERDLDKRFSVCADDVTFFGTGVHEKAVEAIPRNE